MNMKKCFRFVAASLFAVTLTILSIPAFTTQAGKTSTVLGSSSLEDTGSWNNLSGDIIVNDGTLVFPKESTKYTRFVTLAVSQIDKVFTTSATLDCNMKFTQLPEGESFVLGFGLPDIESDIGAPGNVEVTFTNKNGIKIGVTAYGEDGNPVTVCEPKNAGISVGSTAAIKVEIKTDKTIVVYVKGSKFLSGKLPVNGEGHVGFLQTGGCGVEVSGVNVNLAGYERPENTNVSEDFENGTMDASKLSSRVILFELFKEHGARIEEYNGSQVFMMENVGLSYIGTVYSYSNVEIIFDVPYFMVYDKGDVTGTQTHRGTGNFIISFGAADTNHTGYGYDFASAGLVFEGGFVYQYNTDRSTGKPFQYWQEDRGYTIKVSMIDGNITVQMKWIDETEYETIAQFKIGDASPLGKVHFWIPTYANMAIDNLVINNLDEDPNLIETEYQSGVYEFPDYEYQPFPRNYASVQVDGTENVHDYRWYYLVPAAAVLGGISMLATLMVSRKKKAKEAKVNEE